MKKLLLAGILTLAAGVAFAQDFKTGYFLDNYVYSYRVNPGASLEGKPGTFVGVGKRERVEHDKNRGASLVA
jgi:hypothetical protein